MKHACSVFELQIKQNPQKNNKYMKKIKKRTNEMGFATNLMSAITEKRGANLCTRQTSLCMSTKVITMVQDFRQDLKLTSTGDVNRNE